MVEAGDDDLGVGPVQPELASGEGFIDRASGHRRLRMRKV